MVLMRNFCFWCSVRLAAVFATIYGGISSVLFAVMVLLSGPEQFRRHLQWVQQLNEEHARNAILRWTLSQFSGYSESLYWIFLWSNVVHVCSASLGLVASLKLIRPLILQFIAVHTVKLAFYTCYIVASLILLRRQINLGVLILVILLEGLALLFFWYNLAAVIALFQIIKVVNSREYQMKFGAEASGARRAPGGLWSKGAVPGPQPVPLLLLTMSSPVSSYPKEAWADDPNANAKQWQQQKAGNPPGLTNAKPFAIDSRFRAPANKYARSTK